MRRPTGWGVSDCLTMPNHPTLKASTLRTTLTQAGIAGMILCAPTSNPDFPLQSLAESGDLPRFLDQVLLGHAAKKRQDLLRVVLAGRFQLTLIGDSDGLPSGAKNAAAGTPLSRLTPDS